MMHIKERFFYPSNRDIYFDNIKGKLILLVVLGHLLEFNLSCFLFRFAYVFLYSFVMPAFVFVSGIFFSPKLKNITKIFVIYFFSQLSLFLLRSKIEYLHLNTFLTPIWTLWYLLCLFYWYCGYVFLEKHQFSKLSILVFALVLSLLCGFLKIGYFLSLQRAFSFFFFFALGVYVNKEHLKNTIKKLKNWKICLSCIVGLFVLYLILDENFFPRAFYNSFSYYYFFPYSKWNMLGVRSLQFILSFIFGIFLLKNTSHNKSFYTWCGYYSLWIYLIHTFILYYLK